MSVINIDKISKSYGKTSIVEDFSLDIKKGHICGLIGPNGAGKTTIMKILAGLTFQTSGELRFFDSSDLDRQRRRMSFMIEEPIVDPMMTAYDNLTYLSFVRGYPDAGRIKEVLDIVGLPDTGKKRCEKYSLGMRQRLGIAMALLTKPEVLVLDEPVNGLDPEGIVEIRHILKKLSEENEITILISSHLLSELRELCTDFSIINHGKLIENVSADDLTIKCRDHICLRTNDPDRTCAVLENKLSIRDYKVLHNKEILISEHTDQLETISNTITASGLTILKLCEEGKKLEDFYLEKVGSNYE